MSCCDLHLAAHSKLPVGDDKLHSTPLIAVRLKKRTLHDIGIETHVPDGSKLLLLCIYV